ncbi:Transport protein particle (TRAPP) component [Rhizoctonia solani]|uniref:Transport protein particle (TRAPP) component n=1 Tax=Rhizoctonia solani TaxID=456999 RepID=A0A8H7IKG9_9AGAM|nr:Transport protein particle (TRAPP) component [Rhizoctonia solani]
MSRPTGTPSWAPRAGSPASPATLRSLAYPTPKQVDGVVYDILLIEMVRTLRDSAKVARKRETELEEEMIENGLLERKAPAATASKGDSVSSIPAAKGTVDEDEEALRIRIAFTQLLTLPLLQDIKGPPRFTDTLDTVKFICKDLWTTVWEKQVENLRTNHRGVYVLTDSPFKPLVRISAYGTTPEIIQKARVYAYVPAGIIRGALARLGLQGTVTPDISDLPRCEPTPLLEINTVLILPFTSGTFQIKLAKTG